MKPLVKCLFPAGSFGRWILFGLYSNPVGYLFSFFRSLKATRQLTGKYFPVKVWVGVGSRIDIFCASTAKVLLKDKILVNQWGGSKLPSSISCGEGATFRVLGDFDIGPNVQITIGSAASLILGGRRNSTASGITCDSRIMVEKKNVEIGADCIVAWDVFISDSDWHDVKGSERSESVYIGEHVWIAHGVSILKGATVPSGCIIGAKSLVRRGKFPERSFIAGVPATVRRTGVEWSR